MSRIHHKPRNTAATMINASATPDTAVLRTVSELLTSSSDPSGDHRLTDKVNTPDARASTGTRNVVTGADNTS
jgi:hypothetical protein